MENNVKILFDNAPDAAPVGATVTEGDKVQIMFDNAPDAAPVGATIVGLPSGGSSSGGSKVYEHHIYVANGDTGIPQTCDIYLYSKDDTPLDEKAFIEKVFEVNVDNLDGIEKGKWIENTILCKDITAIFETRRGRPDDEYFATLLNLKIDQGSGRLEYYLAGGIISDSSANGWEISLAQDYSEDYRFEDEVTEYVPDR